MTESTVEDWIKKIIRDKIATSDNPDLRQNPFTDFTEFYRFVMSQEYHRSRLQDLSYSEVTIF